MFERGISPDTKRNLASLAEDDFGRKYEGTEYSLFHLLKSLTYFTDAEADAALELLLPRRWEDVREFFEAEARRLAVELL